MSQRTLARTGLTVAGIPLLVSPAFVMIAILFAWSSARQVAEVEFVALPATPPDGPELLAWLRTHDLLDVTVTYLSSGWVLATGAGVALVYFLSVLAHELGHLAAARVVRVDIAALELGFAGGFVAIHDGDRLTAGRLAAIVAAGPLVTAVIAFAAGMTLRALDWPLLGMPDLSSAAGVSGARILSAVFAINIAALALNLLPFRPLDGGQLLAAARLRLSRA
jgi:Zn-dependent protease